MHKMHKRNEILKNSCKGTQRATTLRRKREWKSLVSIKYKRNIKAKIIQKHPEH